MVEVVMGGDSPDSAVNVFPTPGGPLSSMIMPRPVRDVRSEFIPDSNGGAGQLKTMT